MMMKLTIEERLAQLEAEVRELRDLSGGKEAPRGCVKEMLFYSTLEPGDQVLMEGVWETVQSIHDGDPNGMDIRFASGDRVTWKKDRTIFRRAPRERLPEAPNRVSREQAKRRRTPAGR